MSSRCDADSVVTNSSAHTVEECSAHAADKVSACASEVASDYATTSGLGRGRLHRRKLFTHDAQR